MVIMKRKGILFWIAVAVTVLIIVFCTTETVMSQGKADKKAEKKYYASMEKEYHRNMKRLLDEKGYLNSGITIRWISEADGTRNYTVMIYHRKIENLNEQEKEELMHELFQTEFEDERCMFHYEFLTI